MADVNITSTSAWRPVGFQGAPALPLQRPSVGSCTLSFRPLTWSKEFSRQLRPARCCLSKFDGNDLVLRKKENLHIIDRLPTKLQSADTVQIASDKLVQTVPVPTLIPSKPRVILIAGPTAVGKTRLSIELAKAIGGEIINADSVQVYQGLDIGAAKATLEERQGVPHHLMDMVPPTQNYTYEDFLKDSRAATQDILSRGLVPIVVGGTGMYMRWFMHNKPYISSHPFPGEHLTGESDSPDDWDYDFQAYFLYQRRAHLFPRLDLRTEHMVPALLKETLSLLDLGVQPHSNNASEAIGYEEAIELLLEAWESGVVTEARFLDFLLLFQHNCRVCAKRQIAWFRTRTRSDVRQFRWIDVHRQPVEEIVELLVREYERPLWKKSVVPCGMDIMAASLKENKQMQMYNPTLKVYSDPQVVASTLQWIKATRELKGEPIWSTRLSTRDGLLTPPLSLRFERFRHRNRFTTHCAVALIVAKFQHHGACSDENREEGLSRDDREVLLSHDAGLPDEQEDCGGGGHHPVEAAAEQDCRVRDALDEAHPARARARHLAEAAGGGAREAHGLRARGVGDQDRRDRGGPRDHRAAGALEHAAAAGSGAAGSPCDGRVLQATGGRVPGQQEQGQEVEDWQR